MSIRRTRRLAAVALAATVIAVPGVLATATPASAASFGPQVTVGFTGLTSPSGIAVSGSTGSTVLTTTYPNADQPAAVLSKGAGTQTTLAFGDLGSPYGFASDAAGNAYVTDISENVVVKLPAGSGSPVVLSIEGLSSPAGVAVDTAGNVYVADSGNGRVVREPAGGGAQSDVAFTGLTEPYGVAVDATGNLFVADLADNVVKELPAGGGAQTTLGFSGLSSPDAIAVAGGTVYVADADNDRVVTLPVAGGAQATLGFTGLSAPAGIAVSTNGSVFVADAGHDRVVELPVPANSPAQSFVTATYNDYIQRNPTSSELSSGVAAVGDVTVGSKRASFAKNLANTDKYLGAFVNKLYVDTLGRVGDPGGVAYWTKKLRNKTSTPAQVAASFYASNEYFRGFGHSSNTTWVKDLYLKVLLRAATSKEVTSAVAVATSKGRYSEASALYQSLESRKVRVTVLYQRFLNRNPDPSGRDYWAGKISTQGDIALAINLSSSNEYLTKSQVRYP
ncbi:MAG: hypothetical protein JWM89_1634 [Acidimicrobiales bacterium]|nr:hypothetical protein [Acidimicrobiales bacterium]